MLLALPTNIGPGWKRIGMASNIASYSMTTIIVVKNDCAQAKAREKNSQLTEHHSEKEACFATHAN